jgi:hypothetical protein
MGLRTIMSGGGLCPPWTRPLIDRVQQSFSDSSGFADVSEGLHAAKFHQAAASKSFQNQYGVVPELQAVIKYAGSSSADRAGKRWTAMPGP